MTEISPAHDYVFQTKPYAYTHYTHSYMCHLRLSASINSTQCMQPRLVQPRCQAPKRIVINWRLHLFLLAFYLNELAEKRLTQLFQFYFLSEIMNKIELFFFFAQNR